MIKKVTVLLSLFFVCAGSCNIFASSSKDSLLAAAQLKFVKYQSVSCVSVDGAEPARAIVVQNSTEKVPCFNGKKLVYIDKSEYDTNYHPECCSKECQQKKCTEAVLCIRSFCLAMRGGHSF